LRPANPSADAALKSGHTINRAHSQPFVPPWRRKWELHNVCLRRAACGGAADIGSTSSDAVRSRSRHAKQLPQTHPLTTVKNSSCARLARERDEALDQQAAKGEVLNVIS